MKSMLASKADCQDCLYETLRCMDAFGFLGNSKMMVVSMHCVMLKSHKTALGCWIRRLIA